MSHNSRLNDPAFKGLGLTVQQKQEIINMEDKIDSHNASLHSEHGIITSGNRIEDAARHMHDSMDKADRDELNWQLQRFADTGM